MRSRIRDLSRWTTSEVCLVLGEWVECRMHGLESYVVTKGVDERIYESVLQWFGHIERMGNDGIAEMVNVGMYVKYRLVCRPMKRWTDTEKKNLNVRETRRLVQDRNERRGVCEEVAQEINQRLWVT